MNKSKTHKYKPSKNNKSKRNQGGIGSPKIEKNVSFSIGPNTVYLGEVLQEKKRTPHGVGRMTYLLKDGTYADYSGKWENGKKNDDAGRYIVNVRTSDMSLPKYYLEGKWIDDNKEGVHKLYRITTYNPYQRKIEDSIKNLVKFLYFEKNKPADKKIEDAIKDTLDKKKVPDDIIRIIKSYRQH